ncbi:hypothetical protein HDU85_001945 [Gaertneriomyces sp. JEL0708]|nr:hypothetical protein HDU85_001945 [Gaertneriomyces sp. JEL0708]
MSPQVRTFDHYERRVVRTVTSVHVRVTRVTSYITARLPKVKAFEVGAVEPIFEDELQPQSIQSEPKPVEELNAASATDIVGVNEIKVTDIEPTRELPGEVIPDMSLPVEAQADTSTESISDTSSETVSKMRHSDSGIDMREPISPKTRAVGEVDTAVRRSPRVAAASRKPPVTAATTGLSASVRRSRSVMARGVDRSTVPTRATRTPLVRRATSITRLPSENTRVKASASPRSAKPTAPS